MRRLFALLVTMAAGVAAWAAEGYAVYTSSNSTLTFYYGTMPSSSHFKLENVTVGPIPSNNTTQPWWSSDSEIGPNVRKVMFDPSFSRCHPTSGYCWFYGMSKLTSIEGIENLNTDQMVNMDGMFRNCSKLTSLDLSHFNTEKVTIMYGMFMGCSGLTSLDLSSFNTSAVERMDYMFYGCTNLATINLTGFIARNATGMLNMFSNCSNLTSLDLSSFSTSKVTDMAAMFNGCSALTTIYAGDGWTTAAVTESGNMFRNCTNLVGGKGTTFDANHIDKSYARVDGGTSSPGYLTAGSKAYAMWNASQKRLTFYYDKLYNDRNYPVYYLNTGNEDPGWITDGVCGNVRYVMFDASFADARPTSCYRWFDGMSDMYSTVGLEYLNTSEVTNMRKMFAGCAKLSILILSRFNTAKVTDMSHMFNNCSQLVTIVVGDQWNIDRVSNSQYMFAGCNSILGCKGTVYNSANVTKAYAHIDEGASNPGYLSDAKPRGFRYNGIWYDNSNGSEVSIIPPQHYDHYAGEVVIPSQFTFHGNNYTPHLVESGTFTGSGVTRVDLPGTVSVIESGAFTGATSLKTLVIGWGYSPSYAQIGQGFAGGNATGFTCYVKHTFLSKYEEMHPNAYFFAPWVQISETYYPELRPYRPFSCKYNVELPEGLEAYYVKGYDSSTRTAKTQKVTGALPSNTGFLLKGSECKIYLLGLNGENIPPITGNMLKPRLSTDQPWNQSDGNSYFFFNVGDIMWMSTVNISQGESYLCIPNSQLGSDLTSPIYLDLEGGGTSQNGDVNGDGDVNVMDITALIDIIMNDGTNPRADVNGDGQINVMDITALIDIIMNS